jgi:hypothetical protein
MADLDRQRYWPIRLVWRWHERRYRQCYQRWTHRTGDGGLVLHLWALKVIVH